MLCSFIEELSITYNKSSCNILPMFEFSIPNLIRSFPFIANVFKEKHSLFFNISNKVSKHYPLIPRSFFTL